MVLVVGATGLVGSAVCQKLVDRGEKVRALVRLTSSEEKVRALRSSMVELCTGDLKDPASISAGWEGVDSVISTVLLQTGNNGGSSREISCGPRLTARAIAFS